MEHLALYRKWRPQNFKTIIGQDDNVRVLKNAVVNGRTVHAYLFCGTRGTGKTSTARILAKALNCEHSVDGEPCNECEICRGITDGSFMDVIEIDAASNRGIDEVRDLLEKVHFVPVRGKYKVYIIDEAHMLTTEAFNALLKTFEEPPAHVVFILATTESRKVPMTILSRCQRYDFKPINEKTLIKALSDIAAAENVAAEEEAIALLAEKARGSMRDALSLMDQAMGSEKIMTAAELNRLTGSVPYEFWPDFFRSIAGNDLPAVFSSIDEVEREGKDLRQFFRDFRDCAGDLISGAVAAGDGSYHKVLKECSDLFTPSQILEIINVCGESEIVFRYNRDGKAVCRFLMARIMKTLYPAAPVIPVVTEAPKAVHKTVAPKKDFVFPNETVDSYTSAKPAVKSAPPKQEELPPWETTTDFDDLIPPPMEGEEDYIPDFAPAEAKPQAKPEVKETRNYRIPDLPSFDLPDEAPKAEPAKPAEKKEAPAELIPQYEVLTPIPQEEPAPTVEETAPPAEAGLSDDDEIRWAKVLKGVKEKSSSTYTWIAKGELIAVKDDAAIVAYSPLDGLFYDKVREPAHTAVIEEVLNNIFGRPLRFTAQTSAGTNSQELSLF